VFNLVEELLLKLLLIINNVCLLLYYLFFAFYDTATCLTGLLLNLLQLLRMIKGSVIRFTIFIKLITK